MASHSEHSGHDVCGTGFKHLTPVREALGIVVKNLPKKSPAVETIPATSALGRVLAADVVSGVDVPSFDRAAMDGYAVTAEDTYGASVTAPVFLRNVGSVPIGVPPNVHLAKGQTVAIVTGAQMPQGANAVVMVEHSKQRSDGTVELSDEVHPIENVSRMGEDVRRGVVVLKKGTMALPQDLGMLTYLGIHEVTVARRLRVGILSTGNELHEGSEPEPSKIPDVNRPSLKGAVQQLGCEPFDLGIVPDDRDKIRNALARGIEKCDVVLVTAGTSVGPGDMVPEIIDSLGKPGMLVHGVAMRPSMPAGLAVVEGKPVVSLPGYPVSAYIAFLEFVPPLVEHMLGTRFLPRPTVKANLTRRVTGVLGSRTYLRVTVRSTEEGLVVEPVRTSGAGILSSLVQANGFIIVPENVEGYEEGQLVEVELFRPLEKENLVE
ncbi:MAG: gephyrin-like molybdotransferase Glp [Candidatus Bathyarchaeia archaeon]